MNKFDLKRTCVIGAGLILMAAPLLSAHAEGRCDKPQFGPDAKACAAAAQGSTELRRYVERTRGVYGLYYWDYAQRANAAAAAEPAANAARLAASGAKLERVAPAPSR